MVQLCLDVRGDVGREEEKIKLGLVNTQKDALSVLVKEGTRK